MMESGYYPAGAEFDPRAPWNEKEPRMIPCPVCNGKGYTYYNEDGGEISEGLGQLAHVHGEFSHARLSL